MLTVAGSVLASPATDLILLAAGVVGEPAQVQLMTRRDGETLLAATGTAYWCEAKGFPVEADNVQSTTADYSSETGLGFLRSLDGVTSSPTSSVSMSRQEFAETLSAARREYALAIVGARPLSPEQLHELAKGAQELLLGMRLVGPELTRDLLAERPDVDGGRIMHLALILGVSMQLLASDETLTGRQDVSLLRETTEQTDFVDAWITRTLDTHQAS